LHPELQDEWPAWRLVLEGTATLSELSGPSASYSLADVYKAGSLLDMRSDLQQAQMEKERKR